MDGLFSQDEVPVYSVVGETIKLPVIVKPQSRINQILAIRNGRLKIAIASPPVDGKANKMLVSFMADSLGIKTSEVIIANGLTSHRKMIHLPKYILPRILEILNKL